MSYREALPAGTILDRNYRVDKVLGSGGFGITYLAYDLGLEGPVAIKEYFPAQFASREVSLSISVSSHDRPIFDRLASSFLREAQTLAKLDHEGIVYVYSVFEANGTIYLVMRFEAGTSMKVWLENLGRPPTQAELDQLLKTLLSALDHIHGMNFLHRDIAPDNIIIRPDMTPVLVDFGASRRLAGELTATMTGVVKEGYSPQEQYSVNAKALGPWSDIYSLAATLYRAISGRKPDEATARMLADTTEPLVRSAGPGYRTTFLAAIDKAMSLHPSDRPQTVAAWAAALFDETPAGRRSALSANTAAFSAGTGDTTPLEEPPHARGRGGKVALALVATALLMVPAAIAYRPAVIADVANLWLSVTQPKQVADETAPSPPTDFAARPQDSVRVAREQEARTKTAQEARELEAAAARAQSERGAREAVARRQAIDAGRAREAAEAAARAKAAQESRELEAAAARAQAEREDREAARERAEAERQAVLEADARRLREAEQRRLEQARAEAARRNAEKQAQERRRIEEELVVARARIAAQAEALKKAEEETRIARLAAEKARQPEAKQPETKLASLPPPTPEGPAANGFNGRWTLTRVGENCFAGRVLSFSFNINGDATTNGRGRITNSGGFTYQGRSRKNNTPMQYSGTLKGNTGRGTFSTVGGRCAGTFTMRRE